MDNDLFLYNRRRELSKFKVVGLLPSPHFQKARFMVEKIHECFPTDYQMPEIRAMMNLDWEEYLHKMQRRYGKPYYLLKVPVAVYIDGEFLGDDDTLARFVGMTYRFDINLDFEEIASSEIINYFSDITKKYCRKFVYLTLAEEKHVLGSMLFMLYNDLVPDTCENFLSRCTQTDNGYKGRKIRRIARYSWIQFGGTNLKETQMACENYAVPHNRRGVLSMCNRRRHQRNSAQFYITLEPADWMDCNYVAFGQLIQGAEVLNIIENADTYYQNPLRKIKIVQCGEFTMCPELDEVYANALNPPYETLFSKESAIDSCDSILSLRGYKSNKYFLKTDLKAYLPFLRYSRMFDIIQKEMEPEPEKEMSEEEEYERPTTLSTSRR